ncbi:hypothetical protein AVEN_73594-1 [Araneus ventricosus]|uniref:Uncharacterized protein n=1 Tax=Araneus ventricosus TaxID=182803 RepID=A0A4Y2LM05_ARAVE|nr:hypothetical protein AVEN_73594-1 [Araneus ventricosus]
MRQLEVSGKDDQPLRRAPMTDICRYSHEGIEPQLRLNSDNPLLQKPEALLTPDYFGRIRYELDSPKLWGHLPPPPPAVTFPLGARKWAVVAKDNWTPYLAYLLSELRNSPPSKEAKRLRPAFVAVKGKFLDRLARYERVINDNKCI